MIKNLSIRIDLICEKYTKLGLNVVIDFLKFLIAGLSLTKPFIYNIGDSGLSEAETSTSIQYDRMGVGTIPAEVFNCTSSK